ncbi:hypothetical protein D8S78_00245 [Natrialba swarupiae]|nr:hypothetical protein [Natrialba swarupiae]
MHTTDRPLSRVVVRTLPFSFRRFGRYGLPSPILTDDSPYQDPIPDEFSHRRRVPCRQSPSEIWTTVAHTRSSIQPG